MAGTLLVQPEVQWTVQNLRKSTFYKQNHKKQKSIQKEYISSLIETTKLA